MVSATGVGYDLVVVGTSWGGLAALRTLVAGLPKTPVVGSDVGGIPEIIRNGETGRIFPGGDTVALAGAVKDVFNNSGDTQKMREAGRVLVERKHSLKVMLDQIEALYGRHLTGV